MNRVLHTSWIAGLRSGAYKQTKGTLCRPSGSMHEGYCCLGLLAKLAGTSDEMMLGWDMLDQVGLSRLIGPWSDVSSIIMYIPSDPSTHETLQRKLAAMNDGGKTFAEIADWIEKNVPIDEASS